jgi:hypothetical protein
VIWYGPGAASTCGHPAPWGWKYTSCPILNLYSVTRHFKPRSGQRLAIAVQRIMTEGADISTLYREFTQALMDVLAEQAIGPASRGRLARARAAIKKHPEYGEHGYFLAVETAFEQWEALHTVGYIGQPSKPEQTA